MKIIEYRVKIPFTKSLYPEYLKQALSTVNPSIVNLMESGMSSLAGIPSRKTSSTTTVFKTLNFYNLPQLSSNVIKVTTFFKFPYTKTSINGKQYNLSSICSSFNGHENIFALPNAILTQRLLVDMDFTNDSVWNYTNPIAEEIFGTPQPLPCPTQNPNVFIYILLIDDETSNINIQTIVKGFIVLLHRKMISMNV